VAYSTPFSKPGLIFPKADVELDSPPRTGARLQLPSFSFQGRVRNRTFIPNPCAMKTESLLNQQVQLAFRSAILAPLVACGSSYRAIKVGAVERTGADHHSL
jgi:hypothetical protein